MRPWQADRKPIIRPLDMNDLPDPFESVFRQAAQVSGDAILLFDYDTQRFVECNPAALRLLGMTDKQALLGIEPWALSPEQQPDGKFSRESMKEMHRLALRNKFLRFEWHYLRADGLPMPVEVTLTPVLHDGHTYLHSVWRELHGMR